MEEYVLPTMAKLCDAEAKKTLTRAGSLAITVDAWTDVGGRVYLGVTGHVIKDDWTRECVDLIPLLCHVDLIPTLGTVPLTSIYARGERQQMPLLA